VAFIDREQLQIARDEFLLWGWISLIAFSRLTYILFYNLDWYLLHPNEVFALWNGGMSFHGGFIGVIVAAFVVSRRRNLNFYFLTDPVAVVIPWILALGRTANFLNAELPGRISTVPWAVVFPAPFDGAPRHPSQIYEALTEGVLVGVVLLIAIKKWRQTPGLLSIGFTGLYAAARFFTEFTREPDPQIGFIFGLTLGQWLCFAMMMLAIFKINQRD
jgi:phosphatidylglycerol:prolipoprotein diacylglycerol transferase